MGTRPSDSTGSAVPEPKISRKAVAPSRLRRRQASIALSHSLIPDFHEVSLKLPTTGDVN